MADLAGLSSNIEATPVGAAVLEKEATRIHTKLKELKHIRALVVAGGVPGCRFTLDRRISDLERNRNMSETDAGKDINAILSVKLGLDRLMHHNVRDAARQTYAKVKAQKARAKFVRDGVKKRLWRWGADGSNK